MSDVLTEDVDSFVKRVINHSKMEKQRDYRKITLLIKQHPENVDLYVKRGFVCGKDSDGGKKDFKKALKINPNHRLALYNLGKVYVKKKNSEKVKEISEKLLSKNPKDSFGLILKARVPGNVQFFLDEIDDILSLAENSYEKYDGLMQKGWILHNRKRNTLGALRVYKECCEILPSIRALHFLGRVYMISGDVENGIRTFEKAIEMNPNYERSNFFIGNHYFVNKKGKTEQEKCLKYFQRELEIDPTYHKTYQAMGRYFMGLGNPTKALELLDRALELSNSQVTHSEKGNIYEAIEEYEKAFEEHQLGFNCSIEGEIMNNYSIYTLFEFLSRAIQVHLEKNELGFVLRLCESFIERYDNVSSKDFYSSIIQNTIQKVFNKDYISAKERKNEIYQRDNLGEILSERGKVLVERDMKERMDFIIQEEEIIFDLVEPFTIKEKNDFFEIRLFKLFIIFNYI